MGNMPFSRHVFIFNHTAYSNLPYTSHLDYIPKGELTIRRILMPNDRIQQITCIGALLYIVGVFLPIVSIPVVGDISYYKIDNMSGILTVIIAAAAPVVIFMKKEKFAAASAIGVWLVLLWPMLKEMGGSNDSDGGGMLGDLMGNATDPLADLAGRLFSNIDIFSLGGLFFVIGLLTLTVGGIITSLKAK